MKFTFSLTAATLAMCAKANNDTCNPLFSAFIGVPGFRINSAVAEAVVTNPQPVVLAVEEGKFRCGNVESSCCSELVMDDLQEEFAATREWMIGTIGDMRNLTFALDGDSVELLSNLDEGLEQVKAAYNQMSDGPEKDAYKIALDIVEDLVPIIKSLLEDTSNWVQESVNAYASCLHGALRHKAGLTCLACDADWQEYIEYNKTGVKVKFAKNTCDVMEDSCGGIWDAAESYMAKVRGHVISSLEVAGLDTSDVLAIATETELCGDQPCRQFVCESMLNGFIYTPPTVQLAIATVYVAVSLANFGHAFGQAFASFGSRRDTGLSLEARQAVDNMMQASLAVTDMIKGVNPIAQAINAPQRRRETGNMHYEAEYTEDNSGYDSIAASQNAQNVDYSAPNTATRGQISIIVLAASAFVMAVMI